MIEPTRIKIQWIREPKSNARHLEIGNKDGGTAEFRVTKGVVDVRYNKIVFWGVWAFQQCLVGYVYELRRGQWRL